MLVLKLTRLTSSSKLGLVNPKSHYQKQQNEQKVKLVCYTSTMNQIKDVLYPFRIISTTRKNLSPEESHKKLPKNYRKINFYRTSYCVLTSRTKITLLNENIIYYNSYRPFYITRVC